ncbi:MAG TPA: hypothetical protein VKE40_21705 [Gemmataceae bacterium]|nr:hypothetical protein [Gemmataceae bacterium]
MSKRRVHPLAPLAFVALLVLFAILGKLTPFWVLHVLAAAWFFAALWIAATGQFVSHLQGDRSRRARFVIGATAGSMMLTVAFTHALLVLGIPFKGSAEELFMTILPVAIVDGLISGILCADIVAWAIDRKRADPDHGEDAAGNPDAIHDEPLGNPGTDR